MKRAAAVALALAGACHTDPSAPHLARGNVLVNTGHRDEAVAEYREAARLAPQIVQRVAEPFARLGGARGEAGGRLVLREGLLAVTGVHEHVSSREVRSGGVSIASAAERERERQGAFHAPRRIIETIRQ